MHAKGMSTKLLSVVLLVKELTMEIGAFLDRIAGRDLAVVAADAAGGGGATECSSLSFPFTEFTGGTAPEYAGDSVPARPDGCSDSCAKVEFRRYLTSEVDARCKLIKVDREEEAMFERKPVLPERINPRTIAGAIADIARMLRAKSGVDGQMG